MLERLREDGHDDRYLLLGEKLARAYAMLPLAAGPLLAMLFRTHLPTDTPTFAAVLVAWFLISVALLAAVVVRTRQRARRRRRQAERASRRTARRRGRSEQAGALPGSGGTPTA